MIVSVSCSIACVLQANTPYGYVANAGWMDFAPSGAARIEARDTFLRGYAYAENFGWVDFGDSTPANGTVYSNTSATDFGVNHDGRGQLFGYAYSANVGWINFSWAAASDPNRPRVDLVTGEAAGFAYSANIGWINLAGLTMPGVTAAVRFPSDNPNATAGSTVTLNAGVFGSEPLTFQWLFNGVPIPGATGPTLSLTSAQTFHAGAYSVVITRADTSTFPVAAASLTIAAPPANTARPLNLSTRGLALTGDRVLIPGFVVGGAGSKRLLIRAVGPTLGTFGVSDVLADPILTLKRTIGSTTTTVAMNDNWSTNSNLADLLSTTTAVGAFDLASGSADAALLVDLEPGQYSAVTEGVGGGTGVAIVELYDADSAPASSSLINISTRGFVGTGEQVMIPGFVISSEGPKTLLIRAVGPTLADFGVSGTLDDPRLAVNRTEVDGRNTPLLTQDNWGDNPDAANTATVADLVGAFPLTAGSNDAAFVVTLPPGVYTAQAEGTNAATGTVLVEVYEVP